MKMWNFFHSKEIVKYMHMCINSKDEINLGTRHFFFSKTLSAVVTSMQINSLDHCFFAMKFCLKL